MPRHTSYEKITSSDKTAMLNKSNLKLKDDFLLYLKSIQRSPGTIAGYDSDLLIVFTYILDNLDNKDFAKLSKRDLIGFQNWLVERGTSSARIRRLKAAISSLSNYCENILEGDDPEFDNYRSIVRKIENPPLQPVREKVVWAEEELESLLNKLTEDKEYEKACFVALAMFGGRRKAELCRFKVSDFNEEHLVCDGALYKSDPIQTKGNKYLECYTLAKKFKPYLDAWMSYREEKSIDSEWLFPNKSDSTMHIDPSTANSWAASFSRITGRDFYFHSLRHYYCSALIRAGIPDSVVVSIIGWSSSEMLKIYDDNPKDERIASFFKNGDIYVPDKRGFGDI